MAENNNVEDIKTSKIESLAKQCAEQSRNDFEKGIKKKIQDSQKNVHQANQALINAKVIHNNLLEELQAEIVLYEKSAG